MFDYRGLQDVLFMALYIGAATAALLAAVYLLLRPINAFMHEDAPDSPEAPDGRKATDGQMNDHQSTKPRRFGLPMRSSRRLRRWTAALLVAMALSHVWWYGVGQWCLEDDWMVRTILVIMLDHVTLIPLLMAVLLSMLQDRRRPLWPWCLAQLPVVVMAVVGMVRRSWQWGFEMSYLCQLAVIALFITYYIYALWQYGRWLRQNFADLDHKEVWQSLAFVMALLAVYVLYTSNAGEIAREYLSQVITLVIIAFLLWRTETLQELEDSG